MDSGRLFLFLLYVCGEIKCCVWKHYRIDRHRGNKKKMGRNNTKHFIKKPKELKITNGIKSFLILPIYLFTRGRIALTWVELTTSNVNGTHKYRRRGAGENSTTIEMCKCKMNSSNHCHDMLHIISPTKDHFEISEGTSHMVELKLKANIKWKLKKKERKIPYV